MLTAICKNCGRTCYKAISDGVGTRYYEEVLSFRLVTHNGGTPKAVAVHGIYRAHACAAQMTFVSVEDWRAALRGKRKLGADQRGRIPASVRRSRERRRMPQASGKTTSGR